MAGDWMKVEKVTPDKPEIAILARKLGISHGDAFLNWFRVYSWADGITSTGTVPHLSLSDGDTLSRACPGTCAALASPEIGWLEVQGETIIFGNWDRHNGKSAKARAYDTEKKRKQRQVSRNCPVEKGTKQGTREEKRREEKSKKITPLPPLELPKELEPIRADVEAWLTYRKEQHRFTYKPTGLKALLNQLATMGAIRASPAIQRSMANGWQGIHEDRDKPQQSIDADFEESDEIQGRF